MCDNNKTFKFGLRKSSIDQNLHKVSFSYEKINFPTKFAYQHLVSPKISNQLFLTFTRHGITKMSIAMFRYHTSAWRTG